MKKVYIGTAEDFMTKELEELLSQDDDTVRTVLFDLRKKGYAVVAFSPDELNSLNRDHVEGKIQEYGQAIIDIENYVNSQLKK